MKPTLQLGTWLSIGSPAIAELAGLCGLDWVLFDLEHGSAPESTLPDQLRALRGSSTQGVVRVGAPHPDQICRVLDWGAHGIMVPRVESADEAEKIVRAAHYAPRGRRGRSRTVRAYDYGVRSAEETPLPIIMTQIETVAGVQHAADIARVDGVDVLFVGPADLQFDLVHHAAAAPGDFDQCLGIIASAARGAGKDAGILVRELADVPRHLELGFARIAVDSDIGILRRAWQQTIASIGRKP